MTVTVTETAIGTETGTATGTGTASASVTETGTVAVTTMDGRGITMMMRTMTLVLREDTKRKVFTHGMDVLDAPLHTILSWSDGGYLPYCVALLSTRVRRDQKASGSNRSRAAIGTYL